MTNCELRELHLAFSPLIRQSGPNYTYLLPSNRHFSQTFKEELLSAVKQVVPSGNVTLADVYGFFSAWMQSAPETMVGFTANPQRFAKGYEQFEGKLG
jgi:hypothetical protein